VTDEGTGLIEKYIPEFNVKYPMVRATGDDAWKVTGFPTMYLVSPDGEILHEGEPTKAQIEEALKTVRLAPEMPDTRTFSKIRKAWEKRKLGEAWAEVEDQLASDRVDDAEKQVLQQLKTHLEKTRKSVAEKIEAAPNGPDYFKIAQWLGRVQDEWEGCPEAEQAEAMLDKLEDDDAIKNEIDAGEYLVKMNEKYADHFGGSKSKRERATKAYLAFIKKFEGTLAAKQAQDKVSALQRD
jgi:hypothetical protein